ncbi:MAG TPA: hypothetical protein PK073_05110 [Ignavibacteriaceae bacterium]|jgi:GH25 family lysozyme M1 (1,4-beta-N-acetylmuramidase)|nr:MAG: hypothetical protein BWY38_02575 [Ignavibacteria bacterium ADurb.Bin266]OQY72451.1 MAG: hypothetical protein B6D44_10050 [Ignavibacteriales bacterium UTCHB2]HQF42271.1 hypothetical protein [Ignavibacteriaceae bacterium]HQI42119.1 hypothetical protein [Ignavibacteriaceae bacterium]HQJ45874.1 hypothetical protein [Ignavibacteriaceae bacterium]
MTRIILESDNSKDVLLITELAQRLKIKYKIEKLSSDLKPYKTDNQTNYLLKEGVDVSNYGDPSQWQKKVRKDRH